MNGRILEEATPEGRLAAVAHTLALKMQDAFHKTGVGPQFPDYADYREAFRLHIKRELLMARVDEARTEASKVITERMRDLANELVEIERELLRGMAR